MLFDAAEIIDACCEAKHHPSTLWRMVADEAPQLSKLALRLFGVSINAAGDERFFSQTGLTHSKLRNRLQHHKVTSVARLRADLNRQMQQSRVRPRCVLTYDPEPAADVASTATIEDDSLDMDNLTSAAEFDEAIDAFMSECSENDLLVDDDVDAEAAAEVAAAHVRTTMVSSAPLADIITVLLGTLDENDIL